MIESRHTGSSREEREIRCGEITALDSTVDRWLAEFGQPGWRRLTEEAGQRAGEGDAVFVSCGCSNGTPYTGNQHLQKVIPSWFQRPDVQTQGASESPGDLPRLCLLPGRCP